MSQKQLNRYVGFPERAEYVHKISGFLALYLHLFPYRLILYEAF